MRRVLRHDGRMAIPYSPPLPDRKFWDGFELDVRRRRGAACFAAAAAHFGTTSPKVLEARIEQKRYFTKYEEPTSSGKYMRWYRDGVCPSDTSAARIRQRSGGSIDILYWRDLPLWELLAPMPPAIDRLHKHLEAMPSAISRLLFRDSVQSPGRFVHHALERTDYLAIRNIGSLDAFICLLCLACKGDLIDHDPSHFLPARCALDVFPRIVHKYPALAFQWEQLFACLSRIFWERAYRGGASYEADSKSVRENLTALREGRFGDMKMSTGLRKRRGTDQRTGTVSAFGHVQTYGSGPIGRAD